MRSNADTIPFPTPPLACSGSRPALLVAAARPWSGLAATPGGAMAADNPELLPITPPPVIDLARALTDAPARQPGSRKLADF